MPRQATDAERVTLYIPGDVLSYARASAVASGMTLSATLVQMMRHPSDAPPWAYDALKEVEELKLQRADAWLERDVAHQERDKAREEATTLRARIAELEKAARRNRLSTEVDPAESAGRSVIASAAPLFIPSEKRLTHWQKQQLDGKKGKS